MAAVNLNSVASLMLPKNIVKEVGDYF